MKPNEEENTYHALVKDLPGLIPYHCLENVYRVASEISRFAVRLKKAIWEPLALANEEGRRLLAIDFCLSNELN